MGSIGHELRHTIEVLSNPKVTDNATMYFFYDRIATRATNSAFETAAATDAGNAVCAEVQKHARTNSQ